MVTYRIYEFVESATQSQSLQQQARHLVLDSSSDFKPQQSCKQAFIHVVLGVCLSSLWIKTKPDSLVFC